MIAQITRKIVLKKSSLHNYNVLNTPQPPSHPWPLS